MIIATRALTLRRPGGDVAVTIRVFAPEESDGAWNCRYEIGWPERPKAMIAAGEDAVQALLIALHMIGAELYTSDDHKSGQLVFYKPGAGYGFPVPSSIRDLLVGDDAGCF